MASSMCWKSYMWPAVGKRVVFTCACSGAVSSNMCARISSSNLAAPWAVMFLSKRLKRSTNLARPSRLIFSREGWREDVDDDLDADVVVEVGDAMLLEEGLHLVQRLAPQRVEHSQSHCVRR